MRLCVYSLQSAASKYDCHRRRPIATSASASICPIRDDPCPAKHRHAIHPFCDFCLSMYRITCAHPTPPHQQHNGKPHFMIIAQLKCHTNRCAWLVLPSPVHWRAAQLRIERVPTFTTTALTELSSLCALSLRWRGHIGTDAIISTANGHMHCCAHACLSCAIPVSNP